MREGGGRLQRGGEGERAALSSEGAGTQQERHGEAGGRRHWERDTHRSPLDPGCLGEEVRWRGKEMKGKRSNQRAST